jgi:hypothetical protein
LTPKLLGRWLTLRKSQAIKPSGQRRINRKDIQAMCDNIA